jgi:hypothetical protein
MYDKDDYLGRWVQFFCSIPLLLLGILALYLLRSFWFLTAGFACLALGIRCLWYAVTGRSNINKDYYP